MSETEIKVGDTMYYADYKSNEIKPIVITKIYKSTEKIKGYVYFCLYEGKDKYMFIKQAFGKTIFKTQEEAEKKIKAVK